MTITPLKDWRIQRNESCRPGGLEHLSVRSLADEANTTAPAIYSLFGSKDGLIVALGARAFRMLGHAINPRPVTLPRIWSTPG